MRATGQRGFPSTDLVSEKLTFVIASVLFVVSRFLFGIILPQHREHVPLGHVAKTIHFTQIGSKLFVIITTLQRTERCVPFGLVDKRHVKQIVI